MFISMTLCFFDFTGQFQKYEVFSNLAQNMRKTNFFESPEFFPDSNYFRKARPSDNLTRFERPE
jgi:hypothetical protein